MPHLALTVPQVDRPKLNDRLPITGAIKTALADVLYGARKADINRVVVPAAGELVIPLLARERGWSAKNIEASDVSFPSIVTGYAAAGIALDDLIGTLEAPEGHDPDLLDAAYLLWAEAVARASDEAANGSHSAALVLRHLRANEATFRARLSNQFRSLHESGYSLNGMNFTARDPSLHFFDVLDDQGTLVVLRAPAEMKPAIGGRLVWNEPKHTEWDTKTDLLRWAAAAQEAPALVLLIQQTSFGNSALDPLAANASDDKHVVYLGTNQIERAQRLMPAKRVTHRPEPLAVPGLWPILGTTSDTNPDGAIDVVLLNKPQARYYRRLWSSATGALPGAPYVGFLIGGHLAAVISLDKTWLERGRMGDLRFPDDTLQLQIMGASPARTERLARLAARLARCREVVSQVLEEPTRTLARRVRANVDIPENGTDDFIGTYTLLDKIKHEKEPITTYFYESELSDETPEQAYQAWLYQEWRRR